MGQNSEKKKRDQLGMSPGKARNILVNNLVFSMACQLGSSICYKCEDPIEDVSSMSLEHKQDWLDNSPELFFDLNNIAFSHRKCNKPARFLRGEKHPKSKLTQEKVRQIREDIAIGHSQREVAKRFGVDPSTVRQIIRQEIWKSV